MDKTEFLKSLLGRPWDRWGIRSAHDYLANLNGCMGDSHCANSVGSLATAEQWAKALDDAKGRPVYSDEDTLVDDKAATTLTKTPAALLDFACTITTTKRDRDKDVLETKGAKPDLKMPLLWQHIPFEPIGKLVGILQHTDSKLTGHFAIADTELGRDAAALTEFGALRISHGFNAEQWEPLEKDGAGWRIMKFEIMETSLVSIPSNTDAVITAMSREKLHHPMVKGWAKKLHDARPVSVVGGFSVAEKLGDYERVVTAPSLDGAVMLAKLTDTRSVPKEQPPPVEIPPAPVKPAMEYVPHKMTVPIEGSWDWLYKNLARSLGPYLIGKQLMTQYGYCYVDSMFPNWALICVEGNSGYQCFKLGWVSNDNAPPAWDGDPVPVQVVARVEEQAKRASARMLAKVMAGSIDESTAQVLLDSVDVLKGIVAAAERQRQDEALMELLAAG